MKGVERAPDGFNCPYQQCCPHLGGLPASYVRMRHESAFGGECHYEVIIQRLHQELEEKNKETRQQQTEIGQLKAQLQALHQKQFKSRKFRPEPEPEEVPGRKKRGAPKGHPGWTRPKPRQIDFVFDVPAPERCPDCHCKELEELPNVREHIQEDIVLEPRVVATAFIHRVAHCPECEREVLQAGPGELLGSYIGPAAKATALYLRFELNVSERKISRFFNDIFGLKFVPASAYGFERQAVRRGRPLYADLLEKVRSLTVAHADETSWRHDGENYWVWYAWDDDLAAYHWDAHRTSEAAQKLLGEKFGGVLVADAFASYNSVKPRDRQSCLSHIKTRAKEIGKELALLKGSQADPMALQFCNAIEGWVSEACAQHKILSSKPWRSGRSRAMAMKLRKKLQDRCREPLVYPRAEQLRQRLLGPEQKLLFTCFRRPNVPPTNNQAERSLRPVVIMRKVIQGTRSAHGLENHSVLRSLFETARRQGKKPQDFFLNLLTLPTAQAQASLYRKPLTADNKRQILRC